MKARESKEYQRNRKRPGSRARRSRKRTEEAVLGSICEAAEARKVRLNLGMLVEKSKCPFSNFSGTDRRFYLGKLEKKMFVTPIPVTVLSREEGRRLLEE